jgi:hypothetical protein
VSFTKRRNDDVGWFTLDQSALDGPDLISTEDHNPTQVWDAYEWQSLKERVIDATITRSIEFPYNVQSAIADFSLNNYDNYFTFSGEGSASPIAQYILPSRPVRLFLGFKTAGVIPQFVGVTTAIPTYEGDDEDIAKFSAIDFLGQIADQDLKSMVKMRDVTTDQVIGAILQMYGMTPDMYSLATGQNTIPFLLFDKDLNAGTALRRLVQAEGGKLWLDEQGIVRFSTRSGIVGATPLAVIGRDELVDIHASATDQIINVVKIKCDVRAVQDLQPIFSIDNEDGYTKAAADDNWRVPANGEMTTWLSLEDPAWTVQDLQLNGAATSSNFTAVRPSGDAVTTGLVATGELFQDSYRVTFANTNSTPISVNYLQLWGEPAKVTESIDYEAFDDVSIERFGRKVLEISDNNLWGNYKNADQFATYILQNYADYDPVVRVSVKGDPSLQVGDMVELTYKYPDTYIIQGVTNTLKGSRLATEYVLRQQSILSPFTLDVSQLNGPDVLG